MALKITHAKDDVVASTTQYCSRADVLARIPGLNIGTDLKPLANFGSTIQRNTLIDKLLPIGKLKVDQVTGRDFAFHDEVSAYFNGNGGDVLEMAHFGFWPVIDVTSVTIDDSVQDTDTYEWTSRGTVSYSGDTITAVTGGKTRLSAGYFPRGEKNVVVVLDFGFESVPVDIGFAAENYVMAELLFQLAAATANTADAFGGGDVAISIGDMKVQPKTDWKYKTLADRLVSEAKKTCKAYRPAISVMLVTPEDQLNVSQRVWLTTY